MSSDTEGPVRGRHVLSDDLRDALAEAFAGEVAERLPRLQALAAGEDVVLVDVCRDAHTLGSSAIVVGHPVTSVAAREVEALLNLRIKGEDVELAAPMARLLELLESPR